MALNTTDIDSLVARAATVTKAAGTYISGVLARTYVLDFRKHGVDRTKDLVFGVHLDNASAEAAGAAQFILQTSLDGETWKDLKDFGTKAIADLDADGNLVMDQLPNKGWLRYMRLKIVVSTAFTVDAVITAGFCRDDSYGIDTDLSDK